MSDYELWNTLLCSERRKDKTKDGDRNKDNEARTEIERDFDRILFSAPVRRLADKTQVFPLDNNDSVRTRLTHSYEVSNLARSVGIALSYVDDPKIKENSKLDRDIPSLLAAIGLAHDLGNPPFGHQGESAIQSWFKNNKGKIIRQDQSDESTANNTEDLFKDFSLFEGNAHTFRLVTKLQLVNDPYGLNLTYATLAAMLKYPIPTDLIDKESEIHKKHGFFQSEKDIVEEVLKKVGLSIGNRHPLTYVMEACDDIAYSVLDAEDTIKKGLASFADLMAFLKQQCLSDELIERVCKKAESKHNEYKQDTNLSHQELDDISMQMFRTYAIGEMINSIRATFIKHEKSLMTGEQKSSLLTLSNGANLAKYLKEFSLKRGYTHKSVLALELQGYHTIIGLMNLFWFAISSVAGKLKEEQRSAHPYARYLYSRISENYKRIFEKSIEENKLPLWYNQCILLTDMIAGMTDSYALNLYRELKSLEGECDIHDSK